MGKRKRNIKEKTEAILRSLDSGKKYEVFMDISKVFNVEATSEEEAQEIIERELKNVVWTMNDATLIAVEEGRGL